MGKLILYGLFPRKPQFLKERKKHCMIYGGILPDNMTHSSSKATCNIGRYWYFYFLRMYINVLCHTLKHYYVHNYWIQGQGNRLSFYVVCQTHVLCLFIYIHISGLNLKNGNWHGTRASTVSVFVHNMYHDPYRLFPQYRNTYHLWFKHIVSEFLTQNKVVNLCIDQISELFPLAKLQL